MLLKILKNMIFKLHCISSCPIIFSHYPLVDNLDSFQFLCFTYSFDIYIHKLFEESVNQLYLKTL